MRNLFKQRRHRRELLRNKRKGRNIEYPGNENWILKHCEVDRNIIIYRKKSIFRVLCSRTEHFRSQHLAVHNSWPTGEASHKPNHISGRKITSMQYTGSTTCTNGGNSNHNNTGNPITSEIKILACETVATAFTSLIPGDSSSLLISYPWGNHYKQQTTFLAENIKIGGKFLQLYAWMAVMGITTTPATPCNSLAYHP